MRIAVISNQQPRKNLETRNKAITATRVFAHHDIFMNSLIIRISDRSRKLSLSPSKSAQSPFRNRKQHGAHTHNFVSAETFGCTKSIGIQARDTLYVVERTRANLLHTRSGKKSANYSRCMSCCVFFARLLVIHCRTIKAKFFPVVDCRIKKVLFLEIFLGFFSLIFELCYLNFYEIIFFGK